MTCYNVTILARSNISHVQSITGWLTCRSTEKVCNSLKCMLGSWTKSPRSKLPSNRSNIPLVTIGGGIYSNMFKTSAYAVALKRDLMSQCWRKRFWWIKKRGLMKREKKITLCETSNKLPETSEDMKTEQSVQICDVAWIYCDVTILITSNKHIWKAWCQNKKNMLVQLKGTHTLVWFDPALHFDSRLHNWKQTKKKTNLKKDQRVLE